MGELYFKTHEIVGSVSELEKLQKTDPENYNTGHGVRHLQRRLQDYHEDKKAGKRGPREKKKTRTRKTGNWPVVEKRLYEAYNNSALKERFEFKAEALNIYGQLRTEMSESTRKRKREFTCSNIWVEKFKKRYGVK